MFYLVLTFVVVVVWGPDARAAYHRWLAGREFMKDIDHWEYKEYYRE